MSKRSLLIGRHVPLSTSIGKDDIVQFFIHGTMGHIPPSKEAIIASKFETPFPTDHGYRVIHVGYVTYPWASKDSQRKQSLDDIERTFSIGKLLGANAVLIHLPQSLPPETQSIESFAQHSIELAEIANKYPDIVLLFETVANIPSADDILPVPLMDRLKAYEEIFSGPLCRKKCDCESFTIETVVGGMISKAATSGKKDKPVDEKKEPADGAPASVSVVGGKKETPISEKKEAASAADVSRECVFSNHAYCIDTAHVWSQGIDLSSASSVKKFRSQLDSIGIPVCLFHLNGNTIPFHQGRDHHTMCGGTEDTIWSSDDTGLIEIVKWASRDKIHCILERDLSTDTSLEMSKLRKMI